MAFTQYATGCFSDAQIAELLNKEGYKTKNRRPVSRETAREMLQSQTYLGKVRYQPYQKGVTRRNRINVPEECWFAGQHKAVISQELFDQWQRVRAERAAHRQPTHKYNPYILRDLVYCYRCCMNPPTD